MYNFKKDFFLKKIQPIAINKIGVDKHGYSLFKIVLQPSGIEKASAIVQSVKGKIKNSFVNKPKKFELKVTIPEHTNAIVSIPTFKAIRNFGKLVTSNPSKFINFV